MMKGRRQIILIPCWAQISPSGAPVVAISCKQGLRLIVLHRLIACREVEAHKPADLHKRQNAAAHQLINVPDTALEMPGNFQFVQPLDSGRIDVFFGLHKSFEIHRDYFDFICVSSGLVPAIQVTRTTSPTAGSRGRQHAGISLCPWISIGPSINGSCAMRAKARLTSVFGFFIDGGNRRKTLLSSAAKACSRGWNYNWSRTWKIFPPALKKLCLLKPPCADCLPPYLCFCNILTRLKSGRYIAITMVPIMPAKNIIITGSSAAVNRVTASSRSST